MDDFNASRDAFKSDAIDLLWTTIDAFTTEASGLAQYKPKIIFQADWSRGGDAIVANRSIKTVSDLKGKRIAFAMQSPSSTMLIKVLDAGGLSINDVEMVEVANAVDAAKIYKSGDVDAAVVVSPDDAECLKKVRGSHVLINTKKMPHIIPDAFMAKQSYINNNRENLVKFVEGWLKGAAEINTNAEAKNVAVQILSDGTQMPVDYMHTAINNARLSTYGDNMNFFGMNRNFKGVTAEQIWDDMTVRYEKLGWINGRVPDWSFVFDGSILEAVNLPVDNIDEVAHFAKATKQEKTQKAFSKKPVMITFASGSSQLSLSAQDVIELKLIPILRTFPNSRVRLEGNTDVTGSRSNNVRLSKARANAIAKYLSTNYEFDINRFIIIGNGPDVPVCHNRTPQCYKTNRRTEMHIL